MESISSSLNSTSADPRLLDLPDVCNEFNTLAIPSRQVADLYGLIFKPMEWFIVAVAIPAVSVAGILCNVAFFFVLIRVQDMRTLVNFYLANLAVADMCFLLNTLSFSVWNAFYDPVNYASPSTTSLGCILFYWQVYIFAKGSLIFITLMGFERYLAICHPMRHRMINSKHRSVKLVVISWVLSAVLATAVIPMIAQVSIQCYLWPRDDAFFHDIPIVASYCILPPRMGVYGQVYYFIQTIPFLFAMLSSVFCYSRIIIQLSRRTITQSNVEQIGTGGSTAPPSHVTKTRNDIAKMLVVNGIVFFLLSSPAEIPGVLTSVMHLTGNAWLSHRTLVQINWVARCLLYVNSSINPIIYSIVSPRYREAFRKAFGFKAPCAAPNSPP